MLKIYLDADNGIEEIEYRGNAVTAVADITYLIRKIYALLTEKDRYVGKFFKETVQKVIADNDSPVWKDGIVSVEVKFPGGKD